MRFADPRPAHRGRAGEHAGARSEVRFFVAEGPLPGREGGEEEIDRRCRQLEEISRPVTAEGATAPTARFAPDDRYGVAWTLLHIVETGPGQVLAVPGPGPDVPDDDWRHVLRARWGDADRPA